MKQAVLVAVIAFLAIETYTVKAAPARRQPDCFRPPPGGVIADPAELRSQGGLLELTLTIHGSPAPHGSVRYCYTDSAGNDSPTLRVKPGDRVIIHLQNNLGETLVESEQEGHTHRHADGLPRANPCTSGVMSATSTNLHFHGLTIPPVCHQDDVLNTSIQPDGLPFEYSFQIPTNEPPGLYWYHPHIHGFSKQQLLGGASGALIVEGLERANPALAGLPERVFIIRDQDLMQPDASPSKLEPTVPVALMDRDGDSANTGTGFGKPAKDLSINYTPVPYPDYPPAVIQLRPGERQCWRVLNAAAITYLNLQVLFGRTPQPLGLVAIDGAPLNTDGVPADAVRWQTHLAIPPGGRMEFILSGPSVGVSGMLVTRMVDTGPGGENDPNRTIANIIASPFAPAAPSKLTSSPTPLSSTSQPWLGSVTPTRVRRLYFSEKLADPNNATSAVEFYITADEQTPAVFNPTAGLPQIVVQQGTVEDWIVENRSSELHAFHIHQLHFLLMDYAGLPVNEPFLRDTVNVPYYSGRSLAFPSVRLRMDFRDPNIVGTFVYHCHLLEHEDKGMMGVVRVMPSQDGRPVSDR